MTSYFNIVTSKQPEPAQEVHQEHTDQKQDSLFACFSQPFKSLNSQWKSAEKDLSILQKFQNITKKDTNSNEVLSDLDQLSNKLEYVQALIDLKGQYKNSGVLKAIDNKILSIIEKTPKNANSRRSLILLEHSTELMTQETNKKIKEAIHKKYIQLGVYDPKWSNTTFLYKRSHEFLMPSKVPSGSFIGSLVKVKNFFKRQLKKRNLVNDFQNNDKIINLLKDTLIFEHESNILYSDFYRATGKSRDPAEKEYNKYKKRAQTSQRFSQEVLKPFKEGNIDKNIQDLKKLIDYLPESNTKKAIKNFTETLEEEHNEEKKVEERLKKVVEGTKKGLSSLGIPLPGLTK